MDTKTYPMRISKPFEEYAAELEAAAAEEGAKDHKETTSRCVSFAYVAEWWRVYCWRASAAVQSEGSGVHFCVWSTGCAPHGPQLRV